MVTQKVGFTCSTFDLLHAGHIIMLEECKSLCDYLIVGLQVDPSVDRPEKNKPVQSITERYIQLKAVKFVDQIIPYSTEADLLNMLLFLPIDIRILGEEYQDKHFTGREIPGHIEICHFNKRRHSYSSTELRQRITNHNKPPITQFPAIPPVHEE